MLTTGFDFYMLIGKSLKPLANTHGHPRRNGDFFMPLWRECANILNKHTSLFATVSNSRRLGLLGYLKQKANKMKNLITYTFKNVEIRTTIKDGEPWFVATDIAKALEYRNAPDAIRTLDDDEKDTHNMRTPYGNQNMLIINESGLYSLILRSRKTEAKAFKKFVTSEVLPSIRKTGAYVTQSPQLPPDTLKVLGGLVKKCCTVAIRDAFSQLTQAPAFKIQLPTDEKTPPPHLMKVSEAIVEYGKQEYRQGKIEGILTALFDDKFREMSKGIRDI